MTGDSIQFEGITIHCDPVFETADLDPRYKDRVVAISPAAARAIEEAQAKLGRKLTVDEALSCMIHKSCIAVLECAKEDRKT